MYFEIERDYIDEPVLSKPNKFNTFRSHFHKHLEILYIVSGKNEITINGNTKILTANQLSIADSYDVHTYNSKDDLSIALIIPYRYLNQYLQIKNRKFLSTNFITDPLSAKRVKDLIDLLHEHWGNKNELVISGLCSAILGVILDTIPLTNKATNPNQNLINQILHYIDENLSSPLSLSSIAEHFHYSKCYFSSIFNSYFHSGFNNYINFVRCQRAIYLISEKKYSILNATMESGFTSIQTFYRHFKNHYGESPQKYLSKHVIQN